MNLKIALLRNGIAGGWGKISSVIFRFIQVPLLLHALGVNDYGRWLVLSSLPAWLTLANVGFGSVASNEMSMAVAVDDIKKAREIYSTTFALIVIIGIIGTIIICFIAPFIDWGSIIDSSDKHSSELISAVIFLALSVFFSFFAEVFGSRFRTARKVPLGIVFNSFRPWIDLLAMIITLQFTTRFDYLALASLISCGIYLVTLQWISWRLMPSIFFRFSSVQRSNLPLLFKKGFAFQAFPMGNALLFQGNLLIVQAILGPAAVALFGTTRTLVRSVNQLMEMVNQAMWPELSFLLGSGDMARAARLHRIGVAISILAALISVLFLALFGHWIYEIWTGKAIDISEQTLLLFLLPIPFNAFWYTSSVVHIACNKHEGLAMRYLIATTLSVLLCVVLAYYIGIQGAAISTVLGDIFLIPYVLKRSLELTNDTSKGFCSGLIKDGRLIPLKLKKWFAFNSQF